MRKKDGTPLNVLISAGSWYNERNEWAGYQGIVRDVTESQRLEQELAQYRLGLEELVAERTAQGRAE